MTTEVMDVVRRLGRTPTRRVAVCRGCPGFRVAKRSGKAACDRVLCPTMTHADEFERRSVPETCPRAREYGVVETLRDL